MSEIIVQDENRVKEPWVKFTFPLFMLNCVVTGMMMGTGLGHTGTGDWWGAPLLLIGLAQNIYGFVLRRQTLHYEVQQRIDRFCEELKKLAEAEAKDQQ